MKTVKGVSKKFWLGKYLYEEFERATVEEQKDIQIFQV